MSLFDGLDQCEEPEELLRAPFGYPGGKTRSLEGILPRLPYLTTYVEPFGGSGVVLMNRRPSKLDVYNDRYGGVVSVFRVLRDSSMVDRLCSWIDNTIHSREDFITCKATWQDVNDPVERAGRWLYMVNYSFGSLGRNFGRSITGSGGMSGKLRERVPELHALKERFRRVQVENRDGLLCCREYDSDSTVFYLDPPYLNTDSGIYKHKFSHDDHRELLEWIRNAKGYVAVSGYSNPLYDNQDFWDDRVEWDSFVSITSADGIVGNGKEGISTSRTNMKEVLWIKE
jgi:DNA adenine methylase